MDINLIVQVLNRKNSDINDKPYTSEVSVDTQNFRIITNNALTVRLDTRLLVPIQECFFELAIDLFNCGFLIQGNILGIFIWSPLYHCILCRGSH